MTTSERVLSRRAVNRAVLARQGLLERSRTSLVRAVMRMGLLQAQYSPSMYVGLWSRVEGLEREHVTAALEDRVLVQGTLLRGTIHLVARADYWPVAAAIRDPLRAWFLRTTKQEEGPLRDAADRLRSELERSRVLTRAEVERVVGRALVPGVGLWIELVRVPPSGTWERRRADLFALAESWVGPCTATPGEGVELLVRRYLAAFGPAPRRSIASWSGLPLAAVDTALDAMTLRRFRDEDGTELLDLPRAPLPDPDRSVPVRFLPHWDAVLLAHARHSRVMPEEHRSRVFSSTNPQSVATFTVDGSVAGSWRWRDGCVVVEPFAPLDAAARREVDEEAARVTVFHG